MSNRLRNETSPYLLQHADNPVDWHPWDPQALALARSANKPILLSIGYSACHWCHVMAHESFEDAATAELMNALFINIKVDREERPDIDRIYQLAHQVLMGRGGGWPLTAFLTPDDHYPIFVGTYFPRDARYGMPAFSDVVQRIAEYVRQKPAEIEQQGARLVRALDTSARSDFDLGAQLYAAPINAALARLADSFDAANGGFGAAPKFPHPSHLELLLNAATREEPQGTQERSPRTILLATLGAMANRGLYDHLGGGFFRYCVDAQWAIPHFEKMLYDNAALLGVYADAAVVTGMQKFAQIAKETAAWTIGDMQAPDGGFYCTRDADSEGEEGKYYVWTLDEIASVLDAEELGFAAPHYGLDRPPNFESKHWHLHNVISTDKLAEEFAVTTEHADAIINSARSKLLKRRSQRVAPNRDEKRLAAWNGLLIAGLARTARRVKDSKLAESATRAVDFIRSNMFLHGELMATYKDGQARHRAYLDDYAFLAHGLLELLQCRFRSADLEFAIELLDALLQRFADEQGGFFFTANNHENLIHRPKPWMDESIPSGNGIAALALQGFGYLLGETRYLDAATATVRAAMPHIERIPEAHGTLLRALENELSPPDIVVVRGVSNDLGRWQSALDAHFAPRRISICIPAAADSLPGLLRQRGAADSTIAYWCTGIVCDAPIERFATFAQRVSAAPVDGSR